MRYLLGTLAILTLLSSGCGAKHVPMPEPVYGKDIINMEIGNPAPFKGIEFSPGYLNDYLQWKCSDEGKCA